MCPTLGIRFNGNVDSFSPTVSVSPLSNHFKSNKMVFRCSCGWSLYLFSWLLLISMMLCDISIAINSMQSLYRLIRDRFSIQVLWKLKPFYSWYSHLLYHRNSLCMEMHSNKLILDCMFCFCFFFCYFTEVSFIYFFSAVMDEYWVSFSVSAIDETWEKKRRRRRKNGIHTFN